MTLTSYIEDKHECDVFMDGHGKLPYKIQSFDPHVIGIYSLTLNHCWLLDMVKKVKGINNKIVTVVGGPHPTSYPDIVFDENIDMICMGEGEKPLLTLLNNIDENISTFNIPSLWTKGQRNELGELLPSNEIPIPSRRIYNNYKTVLEDSLYISCARGCPYNCNFCTNKGINSLFNNKYYRLRDMDDIFEEINTYKGNAKRIEFFDETFGANKKWTSEFLDRYSEEVDLPYWCHLRFEIITEELLAKLVETGCYQIGIGVESGNEHIRNSILGKNLTNDFIYKKIELVKKCGIKFHTYAMFGSPSETYKESLETIDMILKLKPDVGKFTVFQPYPGAAFFDDNVKSSILSSTFNRFKINYPYTSDYKLIGRLYALAMLVVEFPILRYFLFILVRLPLSGFYDYLSRKAWSNIFRKSLDS
ncbi:MAG: B12-binding domain-containing radical SAM protein [Candidatus Asgardarchaeia archaeon]